MAETTLLKAEERKDTGKSLARAVRKKGHIPCIIYGDKKDPIAASLNSIEAMKLYNTGKMLSQLIDVETSTGEKFKAISKDIQLHPVKGNIIHIDLLRLGANSRISVDVSVSFINEEESPGIKEGGILNVSRYTVELDCPATNIPEQVEADLTGLAIGETIHLSDIKLPEGIVSAITERDITVASIAAPMSEAEIEALDAADAERPEGIEDSEDSDSDSDAESETDSDSDSDSVSENKE
jgi:large subunit ribosomal protein L25